MALWWVIFNNSALSDADLKGTGKNFGSGFRK